jgi:hypothetical protein
MDDYSTVTMTSNISLLPLLAQGTPPHIYKKFFWRLEGSSHLPGGCPCQHPNASQQEHLPPTNTPVNSEPPSNAIIRRDPMRDVPVEKICLDTGKVLETFATAEQAHLAMSESGAAQFSNFKKVLEGKTNYHHHTYKGYFWRVVGSNKLPPTQTPRNRRQESSSATQTPNSSSTTPATRKRGTSQESNTTATSSSSKRSKANETGNPQETQDPDTDTPRRSRRLTSDPTNMVEI